MIFSNFTPPFHTQGRHIVDVTGNVVKLASVNWYGGSDVEFIPSGLETQHRDNISALIRDIGFNSVRLPYSDEMVNKNPIIEPTFLSANIDLVRARNGSARALDVFTAVVESLTSAGILVIVNNHITQAGWCCGANPCDATWANDWFGGKLICRVSQTEEEWITNWETIMRPLAENDLVMGADLRNEVRDVRGKLLWNSWAKAAEKASERLFKLNPNWLMFVEGVSSANDLSAVRSRPIHLSIPNRVVYSAHVYSWSGWGSLKPFAFREYPDFAATMRKNWAYILEEDIAPVWVGEFGTADTPSKGDMNYWKHLVQYLGEVDASWGYWAINPRKPGLYKWEGYGLVGDDWDRKSVRWDFRLEDMQLLGLRPRAR